MGLFSSKRRTTALTPEPDSVWLTTEAKLAALVADVEQSLEHGPVVVLAHFASTLAEVEAALPSGLDGAHRAGVHELLARPQPGRLCVALANELPVLGAGVDPNFSGQASILVAERYPTPDRDEAVHRAAAALPYPCRLRTFLSLDDEVISRFAGDGLRSIVTALGAGADEEISHPMIVKAVNKAQKKIARQARSDVDSASPANWFQINLPG